MNDTHSLVIHLLDKEYRVACPPGEQDNLLRAARYLDNQMREVKQANVIGLERIAIMAALNMSHELLEAREQVSSTAADGEGRVQALLDRLAYEIKTLDQPASGAPL
jgi:cell division protein ZapA